ncbi:MAG: HEAT repeat domain-containing protein [Phycisphaerales bacterium]|nr:HEAT repeat domain-containing protein [Phycisphaerales bacterium]
MPMFSRSTLPTFAGCLALAVSTHLAAPAMAQDGPDRLTDRQLLDEFIHFVFIDRDDVAADYAAQLVGRGLEPREFVELIEGAGLQDRFDRAVNEAIRSGLAESQAASLQQLYREGRLQRSRDPQEIAENIAMLTGPLRGRLLAKERLVAAGEYAVPQLLRVIDEGADPSLVREVRAVLVQLGQQAVMPLSVALREAAPQTQRAIADLLGQIGYDTSAPFLAEVAQSSTNAPVREAAQRALSSVMDADGASAHELYVTIAENFSAEVASVTSFPGEGSQPVWSYQPTAGGLIFDSVPTPVFHEMMAMRLSEDSLRLVRRPNAAAAALWVASYLRLDIERPEDANLDLGLREPMYYAVASGSTIAQNVLARALATSNTQLARRAIEAIGQTAGGQDLWVASTGTAQPLVESLTYPNRRVQYEAALAFASAQPDQPFDRSDLIAPILASSIRGATDRYALVVASDPEVGRGLQRMLEGMGFRVSPAGESLDSLREEYETAASVDLVVASLPLDQSVGLVAQMGATSRLLAAPLLMLSGGADEIELRRRYGEDRSIAIRTAGLRSDQMQATIDDLVERTLGGPISEEEATIYAALAIDALVELAVSDNRVIIASDATTQLVQALGEDEGLFELRLAELLSWIDAPSAQQAVFDRAIQGQGAQRVALLGHTANSARRHGNQLLERQIQRLLQIARDGNDAEAIAAAGLLGSLGVPSDDLAGLILDARGS